MSNGRLGAWRAAVRIARRDAVRTAPARRRSLLIVVMVAVPVALAAFLSVAAATSDVTVRESLPWTLGQADALVNPGTVGCPVTQSPLADSASSGCAKAGRGTALQTEQQVAAITGGRLLAQVPGSLVATRPDGRRLRLGALRVDTTDPLVAGMFPLAAGVLPRSAGEVAVVVGEGVHVGDELHLTDGATARVVGILGRTPSGQQALVSEGTLSAGQLAPESVSYLVDTPDPVDWQQVKRWNAQGLTALSRAVALDPPPVDPNDPNGSVTVPAYDGERSLLALTVIMVVIEVVLLAAPAFAVGIRRQRRRLALVVAVGGTGADVTRIVLAQAAILGLAAAAAGAVLGVVAACVLFTVDWPWWGGLGLPLEVRWPWPVAVAVIGVVAAVLAAAVPSVQAAREDVVTALAGRRRPVAASRSWPVIGVALIALSSVAVVRVAAGGGLLSELDIAWAAVVLVVGAVLVIPTVVGGLARLTGRAPLALRYAAREAVRHRGRTSPAVAAVMATVAGLTALAVGGASDDRQSQLDYVAQLPAGATTVSVARAGVDWDAVVGAVPRLLPGRTGEIVGRVGGDGGNGGNGGDGSGADVVDVTIRPAGSGHDETASVGTTSAESVVAAPQTLARSSAVPLSGDALQALDDGRVVVVDPTMALGDAVDLVLQRRVDGGPVSTQVLSRVPAFVVDRSRLPAADRQARLLLTPRTAQRLGLAWGPTRVLVSPGPTLTERQQQRLEQDMSSLLDGDVWAYTERGYHPNTPLILLALFVAAILAALVGALTATGLALSDAQPDFATLAAVGAPPRIRRAIGAWQAAVITLLGAGTGVLVGLVPGIAVTWPLTRGAATGHVLVVPWAWLAGVVVVLPLLTALVAAGTTRSAVPLTRRLTD